MSAFLVVDRRCTLRKMPPCLGRQNWVVPLGWAGLRVQKSLLQGVSSKTPRGRCEPRIGLNRVHTIFSSTYAPLHLKGATYGFSLAYLKGHHHYSCSFRLLWHQIRTLKHKHLHTATGDPTTSTATTWLQGGKCTVQRPGTKAWFMSPGETEQDRGLITLLRTACNLKSMNCLFLEFST